MSENGAKPKGASRFDLEETYQEFIRVRGFDIRHTDEPFPQSQVSSTRDTRDPTNVGEKLLMLKAKYPDRKLSELADDLLG